MDNYKNIEKLLSGIQNINIPEFYANQELVLYFVKNLKELGRGGGGAVINELVGTNIIVKVDSPCRKKTLDQYCSMMKEGEESIKKFPYGDNSYLLQLPNYLSEGLIGGYMYELLKLKYTQHCIPIYGTWLSPETETSYIIMPKLETSALKFLHNASDVFIMLFHMAQCLFVAQQQYEFVHYDLHAHNILFDVDKVNTEFIYLLPGSDKTIFKFVLQNTGFVAKMADYGYSRIRYKDTVISPRVDSLPSTFRAAYNTSFDMVFLVGSLFQERPLPYLKEEKSVMNKYFSMNTPTGLKYIRMLLDCIWTDVPIIFDNKAEADSYLNTKYKVNPNVNNLREMRTIDQPNISYYNTCRTTIATVHKLCDAIITFNKGTKKNIFYTSDKSLIFGLPFSITIDPTIVSSPSPPLGGFTDTLIAPGITVSSLNYITDDPVHPSETAPSPKQMENCAKSHQYIHIAKINIEEARASGYSLKLVCCKLDPVSYMLDKFGLVINAGFFDIFDTYMPIGRYRSETEGKVNYYNLPVPILYEKYYGVFGIRHGIPTISAASNFDSYSMDQYVTVGPLLVWDGEVVFTREIENTKVFDENTKKNVSIFKCAIPNNEELTDKLINRDTITVYNVANGTCTSTQIKEDNTYFNCNTIKPGELSHASNPNPRSVVVIFKDGSLGFVYIEGRDKRGFGLSLVKLAHYCRSIGARYALNLDGGNSSIIAWRTRDNPTQVVNVNPKHMFSYPDGNLIAMVKDSSLGVN